MAIKQLLSICLFNLFYLWFMSFPVAFCDTSSNHNILNTVSQNADKKFVISEIIIKIVDAVQNSNGLTQMACNLISLKKGDKFCLDKFKASLSALKLCKKFSRIHVESKEENSKITLIYHLAPSFLIKDIKISGTYPLFEQDVLNVMTIYSGDIYDKKKILEQKVLITNIYEREGFETCEVVVTARQDPKNYYYIVHVDINKGDYFRLKDVKIINNKVFSDTRLKMKMRIWKASLRPGSAKRFIADKLKKDINTLLLFYRKKKYPEVQIDYKIKKNIDTKKVEVVVFIKEGRFYKVEFSGNKVFWSLTLRKDLILFRQGNINNIGIIKSIKKIKEHYKKKGYYNTQIKVNQNAILYKKKAWLILHRSLYRIMLKLYNKNIENPFLFNNTPKKNICLVKFIIDEGPQTVVRSINITGNYAFNHKKIKKQMLTHLPGLFKKGIFLKETLKEDLFAIKALYMQHGYMDAEITSNNKWSMDKTKVDVNIIVKQGPKTLISSVKILGSLVISDAEAYQAITLRKNVPFRKYMLINDENILAALIAKKGYPHVKVKGDFSLSPDHKQAIVVFNIDKGHYVKMGHVYFTGNFRTRENILQDEIKSKYNDPFSLTKILKDQRNIRNMRIFNSVKFKTIGLKKKSDQVNLFVELEEKKPYFFQTGGGYETAKGNYFKAKIGDNNLFGINKEISLSGESSEIGYRSDMEITDPKFFGFKTSASLELFIEKENELNQNFGTRRSGAVFKLTNNWFKNINAGISFNLERRKQLARGMQDNIAQDDSQFDPRVVFLISPSISYDTRDSFIRPKKGRIVSFSVDIATGIKNSLDDFFKYKLDLRHYYTPISRFTLAILTRGGYIDPSNSKETIPKDQLFFLGGTGDIRGFKENFMLFDENYEPKGGLASMSASIEARIDIGYHFEFTCFYDVGSITDSFDKINSDTIRSAAGIGIRYVTAIGPIGLLYGVKLDRKPNESPGRVHFSIGYTF